jgi:hypothetical protein
MTTPHLPDEAGAQDSISSSVNIGIPVKDVAGAVDSIQITKSGFTPPVPATKYYPPANPAFIKSVMPRMHCQNLVTGQWLHRDVQGTSQPSVTWAFNSPDSFTVTLSPPRKDMMTAAGEPLLQEWRDAVYLEENDQIKWGGILTSSTFNGPAWALTCTGFAGYASGAPYEGASWTQTNIDALDVVRYLWSWLQSQSGANIGLALDNTKAGGLLGAQVPPGVHDTLARKAAGHQPNIWVFSATLWQKGMYLKIGNSDTHFYQIKTVNNDGMLTLTQNLIKAEYAEKLPIVQIVPPVPFNLAWWNSTDIAQEITSIQQEVPFDWREVHTWHDSTKQAVNHRLAFGAPRIGMRRTELRFCEGENIMQAGVVTRDGNNLATTVLGLGAGQGSAQVRATAGNLAGQLRRVTVYTDQTVKTVARMAAKATKVHAAMQNIDTVTSIVIKNHPNAAFGSFAPGDDIPVQLRSGWRNTLIWSRVMSMTQDPTTNLMTVNLARSDSFDLLSETGQAGTL